MERDPNTLSPKMLQGFAEPKASGEGSSVPCAPVPAVTESPNLYPPAHLQNTQSRASVPWCDLTRPRLYAFPRSWLCSPCFLDGAVMRIAWGGFSGLCGADGSGMRFQHRKRPLLRQYTKITLETLNVFVRYLKKHVAVRRCSWNGLARISARHFGSSGSPKQLPPFAFGGGLKGKSWTLGFSFSCRIYRKVGEQNKGEKRKSLQKILPPVRRKSSHHYSTSQLVWIRYTRA